MRFSVCIPFYNTNIDMFKECLESVCSQKGVDIEVVIINDGSDERSSEKLIQLLSENNRSYLHLVEKKHSGLRDTRITGFNEAKGDYIISLDSDDCLIGIDALSKLQTSIIELEYPDIICFNASPSIKKIRPLVPYEKYFGRDRLVSSAYFAETFLSTYELNNLCFKCVSKRVLNSIEFSSDMEINMCEDRLFSAQVLSQTSQVGIFNESIYFYRQHDESMVSSPFTLDNYYQRADVETLVHEILGSTFSIDENNAASCIKWIVGDLSQIRKTVRNSVLRQTMYSSILNDEFFLSSLNDIQTCKNHVALDIYPVVLIARKAPLLLLDQVLAIRNLLVRILKMALN